MSSDRNEYNRAYYAANRDKERMRVIYRRYGVTAEEYAQRWAEQGGKCKICATVLEPILQRAGSKRAANACCLDHDHVTGKARGFLCMPCNLLLGYAKDRPDILQSAVQYLTAHIKE